MRIVLFALSLAAVGCDSSLSPAGGPCSTSEECEAGLLCDFGKTPHVCASMSSVTTDLSAALDGGSDGAADAATD
jgi:hypothetical protein